MKKIKQGHTRWQTVVYEPGKIEGYDDCHVAMVFSCFVTKVVGNTIYYTTSDNNHYFCNEIFFNKLHKTFRKALKDAKEQIAKIDTNQK